MILLYPRDLYCDPLKIILYKPRGNGNKKKEKSSIHDNAPNVPCVIAKKKKGKRERENWDGTEKKLDLCQVLTGFVGI